MHWESSTLLAKLADYPRLGLVTDVDGTISHIVARPDDAEITPRSRDLLRALQAQLALVAVISGRTVRAVQAMIDLPGVPIVGNHGLEWWREGRIELVPAAVPFRPALEAAAADLRSTGLEPGVWIEDKGATLSIHYRQAADPAAAAEQLGSHLRAIASAHHLKVFQGNMIFELRPPLDINKGSAFQQLIETYHLDAAVYLGDDTTDLDALRLTRRLRESGLCYAVGLGVASDYMPPTLTDYADVIVDGVSGVEAFLAWLLIATSASST